MVANNCSEGGAGGGSKQEVDEKEEWGKFLGRGRILFLEFQCGAETPRSLVELSFFSH